MKIISVVLGLATLAVWVCSVWLAKDAGVPGLPLWPMFLDSHLIEQLVDELLAVNLVVVIVLGLLPRSDQGVPGGAGALKVLVWIAPILGLLAAVQSALVTWEIAQRVHVTNFRVIEPSLSGALIPVGMGLLSATIGSVFLLRAARPAVA